MQLNEDDDLVHIQLFEASHLTRRQRTSLRKAVNNVQFGHNTTAVICK